MAAMTRVTASRRQWPRVVVAASAALAMAASGRVALAQQTGFAVNRFDPSDRGSEWFAGDSLDLRGRVRPAAGMTTDWSYRPLVVYWPDGNVRSSIVRNQITTNLGASLVLVDRVRVGLNLPVQVFADGRTGYLGGLVYPPPKSDQAVGDLRLSADGRLLGAYGDPVTLAIGLQVALPTGDRASYSGDGEARVMPRLTAAGDVSAFVYSARLGYQHRGRSEVFGGHQIGSELVYTFAAGARLLDKKLVVGPEVYGSTVTDGGAAFKVRSTPIEALLGAHYTLGALRLGGGVATGLARAYGTPVVRGVLSVEWAPEYVAPEKPKPVVRDRDGDGIPDELDACPEQPGPKNDEPHRNGCPPVGDRDRDGILDDEDRCPDVPGPRNQDTRFNGCPPDRDDDGIYDAADACPDVPGVEQADPKKNGCPPDSDDDGILDADDACPDVPGIKSDDPSKNGCPNPDLDGDGIPNEQDACPNEAGPPDPNPKRNGCPKAFLKGGQIRIMDQVKFKPGSAEILPGKDSQEVLEAVAKVLRDHPEVRVVRVEGHTDNTGNPAANKKLSAARAASVVKWLVKNGIDAARLKSEGFGQERPLDSNSTDEGRRNNRRVELNVIEQAAPPSEEKK
jgi:outer membrane protein OmpA-like peptidoglycan-associated protein